MIVTEFEFDRYQGGNPLRVLDLGDGLNVALADSQASRFELLNLIPVTLYGPAQSFWGDAADEETSPRGAVTLRSDHGVFRIERRSADEQPTIHSPDGRDYDPDYLPTLLDGVSLKKYRELFTFNLRRLRQLARKTSTSAEKLVRMARFLKTASPAAEVVPPAVAVQDLSGPSQVLGELVGLLQTESERRRPQQDTISVADREKLSRELKKVDGTIADSRNKLTHLQKEIDETQCALALNRSQARLVRVDRGIADAQPVKTTAEAQTVTDDNLQRLDEKINDCRAQLKQLDQEKSDLVAQGKEIARLGRNDKLIPHIEAMLLHEKSLIREDEAIEQLKLQVQELESQIENERLHASTRSSDVSSSLASDARSRARLDALADRIRESEREQESTEQSLARAEAAALGTPLPHAVSYDAARPEDALAVHDAEQRVLALRERAGMDDQLQRLALERDELEARIKRLYREQLLPFHTLMMLGIPFMIGVGCVIYGLFMYGDHANWKMVLIGLGIAFFTAIAKMTLDRGTGEMLVVARERLAHVNHQLEAFSASQHDTAPELMQELELAERELAELQSRYADSGEAAISASYSGADAAYDSVTIESARSQMNDAQRRLRDLQQDWRDLLIEIGLPPTLTAAHAREALVDRAAQQAGQESSELPNLEFQLRQLRSDLDRRRDWSAVLLGQVRQLGKDLGHAHGGSIGEQFDVLREAIRDHKERSQQRRQLARSINRIRQQQARVKETGRRFASQRKQHATETRQKRFQRQLKDQLRSDRLKLLQQQRETLEQDIAELQDRYGISGKTALGEFSDDELEARLETQGEKLNKLRDKLIRQSEQRGRLRALISLDKELDTSHATADWTALLHKADQLKRQLAESSQSVQRTAHSLAATNGSPQRFEYLGNAADYLSQLTRGQFAGIELVDEDQQMLLVDEQGRAIPLNDINPGHFPNLYLSLWLARLEAYADRGVRLPIVIEDPLEATRRSRKQHVARLLRDFGARGYQLFLVSSQPEHATVFAKYGVPVADFSRRESMAEDDDPPTTPEDALQQNDGAPRPEIEIARPAFSASP